MSLADAVLVWADTMTFASAVLFVVLPICIWSIRNHPLMAIRMPEVVILEILINMTLLFLVATQFGTHLLDVWGNTPCWYMMMISTSLNPLLLNVSLARALVFYRTVQANAMSNISTPIIDKIIHVLGVLFAPPEFFRLETRIKHLKRFMASSMTSNGSDMSDTRPSIVIPQSTFSNTHKLTDYLTWLFKMLLWFIFWNAFEFLVTWRMSGDVVFLLVSDPNSVNCWVACVTWVGSMLCIVAPLNLAVALLCARWTRDEYGLKTELVSLNVFLSLYWLADGLIQAIAPDIYGYTGIWTDLSIMFFHSLFCFLYPLGLIFKRKLGSDRLKNSKIHSPEDLMKIWATEEGRAKIFQLAQSTFTLENVLFLSETETLGPHLGHDKLNALYHKFIDQHAPFELNIPVSVFQSAKVEVERASVAGSPLKPPSSPLSPPRSPSGPPSSPLRPLSMIEYEVNHLSIEDKVVLKILVESRTHVISLLFLNFRAPLEKLLQ